MKPQIIALVCYIAGSLLFLTGSLVLLADTLRGKGS
jgi:hypothetical protein